MARKPKTNPRKKTAKRGRPTSYKPEYCEQMEEFFERELTTEKEKMIASQGKAVKITVEKPCLFPTFERFAVDIGVHSDTLQEWRAVHEAFSVSFKKCKDIQKNILMQNAMQGHYDKVFSIFVAKNCCDMNDKIQTENTNSNINISFSKDE